VQGLVLNQVKVEQEPFTVYISGIDVYGEIETNSRSDVNIMAVVNPSSHQILLITTPRDYYVEIPGISGGACDKLTHAGIYGVDASMSTLEEIYDTEIDFYARVNFTSLIQMVDALGGVDVESEIEFTTSTAAGCVVDIHEGINHLDGEQALAFCRERKKLANGDNQRGMHQQAVITAMIQKAVSPAILMGANELLDSVSGNVDTNMSTDQIQALVKSQLSNPSKWMIKSVAAIGVGSQQYCYSSGDVLLYVSIPDYDSVEEIAQMIDAVEQGDIFEDSKIAQ
jgi:LCP family protein required for cell wall assembly